MIFIVCNLNSIGIVRCVRRCYSINLKQFRRTVVRYSRGDVDSNFTNKAVKYPTSGYPILSATSLTFRLLVCSKSLAISIRTPCKYCSGDCAVAFSKTTIKCTHTHIKTTCHLSNFNLSIKVIL
jgi:hypothetical protein